MYVLERANLVASRTMGSQRYLNTFRQQNQGIVMGGDTDVAMHEEGKEEQLERDPPVPEDESNLTQVVTTFRNELNKCLEREQ